MSLKSLIQTIIILIIIIILGSVYYSYFANNKKISLEKNDEVKIDTNEKNKTTVSPENFVGKKETIITADVKENNSQNVKKEENENPTNENNKTKKKTKPDKPKIDNIVKDIEYLTTDKNGNKYKILATSGRTNSEDKDILDLDNVRGVITSNKRSTVYIVSDFA